MMNKTSDFSINSQVNSENTINMSMYSIDKDDQTFELKKKLKILKQAIVKERQEKQMFQQKINEQQKNIDHLTHELTQKDNQYTNLKGLLNKIAEKIVQEKQLDQNNGTNISEINSQNIEDTIPDKQDDIMQQVYKYIEDANNDVWHTKYQELKNQQQEQQQHTSKIITEEKLKYSIQISDLQLRVSNLEKQLEEEKMKSQYHENEQKKIGQSYQFLSLQQQEQMEKYHKKIEQFNILQKTMEEDQQAQQIEKIKIQKTEFELVKAKAQIEGMQTLLKQKQDEIECMEDKLQVYDAYKIMMLSPVKCQITLRRNLNNKCFINIETPNEVVEIPAKDIQELGKVDTNSKQFILKYIGAKSQVMVEQIEIEDQLKLKKICKQIKRFIVQSEDERREQQQQQNQKVGEEKSFFSQFSAIFQN